MSPADTGSALPSIQVTALNTLSESRGSIHDDEKAREMGYRGGLVPGVTVLAYMTRLMGEAYGRDWAIGGSFEGVIRRPVYEGDVMTVTGELRATGEDGEQVHLEVHDPEGNVCAIGEARTPAPRSVSGSAS